MSKRYVQHHPDSYLTMTQDIGNQERQSKTKRTVQCKESPNNKVGNLVLIRREPPTIGESRKLAEKYRGPYIVTDVLPNDRYRIKDLPEIQRTQKLYKGVAAVDSTRRYCTLSNIEEESEEQSEGEQKADEHQEITQETEEQAIADLDIGLGLNTK
nr:unnamed protein product [Callosobruchus analis]